MGQVDVVGDAKEAHCCGDGGKEEDGGGGGGPREMRLAKEETKMSWCTTMRAEMGGRTIVRPRGDI